jgi:DnaJ-class molecular chaperone
MANRDTEEKDEKIPQWVKDLDSYDDSVEKCVYCAGNGHYWVVEDLGYRKMDCGHCEGNGWVIVEKSV